MPTEDNRSAPTSATLLAAVRVHLSTKYARGASGTVPERKELIRLIDEALSEPAPDDGDGFIAIDCALCKDAPAMHVCGTCGTDGAIWVRAGTS